MASFNKVILMGRLTADPEMKQTPSGVTVTNFGLAVDRRGKDAPCDFINVVAWRGPAEFICRFFKKGQHLLLVGEIQTRSWQDPNGNKRTATEVVASEAYFCEAKASSEGNSVAGAEGVSPANFEAVSTDEDLPF